MDAIELVKRGTDEVVLVACGKCGVLASPLAFASPNLPAARAAAEACCRSKRCKQCDAELEKTYFCTACAACVQANYEAKEARVYEMAIKVPAHEWDGPVFVNDEFFSSVDECLDWLEDNGHDPATTRVYGSVRVDFPKIDAADIVDRAMEDRECGEDAREQVTDIAGLQSAIDAWVAKQAFQYWHEDRSRAVIFAAKTEGA